MIRAGGRDWGTAAELAARLGPDVTPDMIYRWRDRDRLAEIRVAGKVYSPLDQAAIIERNKRVRGSGRPRRLDSEATAA